MRQVPRCWILALGLCWGGLISVPDQGLCQEVALRPASARALPPDHFEANLDGWQFVGGEEFPGARGSLNRDLTRAHGGQASARLDADLRGGGAYVGIWKDLAAVKSPAITEMRVWVQVENLHQVGVRVVDSTGQCHQSQVALPPGSATGWQELVLRIRDLVGGEHWGGVNDGRWHGPPTGLGINVGRNALGPTSPGQAALWIDDVVLIAAPVEVPTLRAATLEPPRCRPGYGTRIHYTWDAEPLGSDCSVFVHFVNAQGQMVFQADHEPAVPTLGWSGRVEYARSALVPVDLAPGRYDVVVGFWDSRPSAEGGGRKPFQVGPGMTPLPDNACRVGSLEVANDALLPRLPTPTLDLAGYNLTFAEDFATPLDISAWGPGTRWIAHTPYGGDFGDAGFGDPGPDSPFTVVDGELRIEARKRGDRWRSGLISSVDPKGSGFAQQFGYFEMRARLPKGSGTWPAFWLMGVPQLQEPKDRKTIPQIEIDVVEQYGVGPHALHTTLHLWGPGKFHWAAGDMTIVSGMTDDFHTYGVSVEDDWTIFYFDGAEIRRDKTPANAKVPLYLMVDLALGGGWPIDQTPNPSILLVDHIRVYQRH